MAKQVAKNRKMMSGNKNPNGQTHAYVGRHERSHGKKQALADWSYRPPPTPERLGDSRLWFDLQ